MYQPVGELLEPNKVLVLYGPRRVGKTTLLEEFLATTTLSYRFDTGDDLRIQEVLSSQRLDRLKEYVGKKQLIVLDEAQNIPNIGLGLKLNEFFMRNFTNLPPTILLFLRRRSDSTFLAGCCTTTIFL
jgi:predicted AAA+ superfamily ATPase